MKYLLFIFFVLPLAASSQELKCVDAHNYESLADWQTFDDDLRTHSLILVGEGPHIMPVNTYLQTDLLIHLNARYGTRYAIIEWGLAEAYLLNKYMKTGDPKYYNKTFEGSRNFKEAREAIEKLYHYNKSVPDSAKVKFVGVDFERDPALTSSIHFFLSEFEDPVLNSLKEDVKARFDTINFVMEPTDLLAYVRKELPKYANIFSQSEDWKQIKDIVDNESSYAAYELRDQRMVAHFLKLPPNERYLGFFGTGHIQLDYKKAFAAMLLNTTTFTRADILTINIHHENSYLTPDYPIGSAYLDDRGFFKRKTIKKHLDYFQMVSDCETFLLKIQPINKEFEDLQEKGDYVLFTKNQKGYTRK
ncbi:MAG: hypothetical protein WBA74_13050 [Cyclobacteriaceae bacterium]